MMKAMPCLLLTVALSASLTGCVNPVRNAQDDRARWAKAQLAAFAKALKEYRDDVGRFPTDAQGLSALIREPNGVINWRGSYLASGVPNDPWGHRYIYRLDVDRGATVECYGADGRAGGIGYNADIVITIAAK